MPLIYSAGTGPPGRRQMHVLILTVFVSLVLVAFFLTLYWQEQRGGDSISGAERDALLPLGDNEPGAEKKEEEPATLDGAGQSKLLNTHIDI